MDLDKFRQGIFVLGTNFGELAQIMIEKLEGFAKADGKYYDLMDENGKKVEVKFSRANRKMPQMDADNVIDLVMNSTADERPLLESEATTESYDCNIQQIKPSEFDFLYYGIFFKDKIVIFRAPSEVVPAMPGYSIQHKGGHEYQFHIKKKNYSFHRDNFFYREISYEELFELLSNG